MFTGSIVALITPFRDGQVDESALRRLVRFHVENGTDGIVPCGTTGEAVTLGRSEWERVVNITLEETAGRIPVIAGAGTNDTAKTVELVRYARSAGATGALVVTPYYNKPTQRGLIAHYAEIAHRVDLPLIVYNVPGRTGVNVLPETLAEVMQIDAVVAVKEASGNLEQIGLIGALCGDRITLLSGDDTLTLPVLSVGGRGVISVVANIIPRDVADMVRLYANGHHADALERFRRQLPLSKAMFIETNPIPVKTAVGLLGLAGEDMRLPLVPMEEGNRAKLARTLCAYGLLQEAAA
ncbi:MAG: 4-hydroxy-tetrahydrodipicolinate synthase [candidate division Zixibacteria bacterium]|nr:4-hydroxy-tetrahydrodipicolinate synthase [candidate division Zixibacteria bacterium]